MSSTTTSQTPSSTPDLLPSATTSRTPTTSPSETVPSTTIIQAPCSTVSNSLASTSSQAPLSSASYSTRWDVFLSFCGSDTRNKFTGHLYDKLDSNGIRTFKDDPELRSGEVISDALLDAIRKSKTYIVVLSENYASSSWCLDELAEILSCYNKMQRLVIPVFYNINPAVVRYQTGIFKKAFQKHHDRFEIVKVNNWRHTLTEVANFSGYHVSENRSEADLINEIVNELLLQINPKTLDVTRYPVGLDSRVKAIMTLLSGDKKGVIKFGIYGMGGVGKTTLAKALFNQLVRGGRFKGSCFLANVRENSGTAKGLVSLQQQLINDVLNSTTKVEVQNVDQGINYIRERISSAKVLVLIDDVYDLEQFEYLAGPFASGSVVIITTRDEEMLDKVNVEPEYRYMLDVLDDAQSRELFTEYAFKNAEPPNNLLALYEDILGLAGGLPLAIRIFGSYLSTKKEVGWISYIETLQKYPNSTIEQKLVISLDALEWDDRMLKKIFVDIACFFIGWDKETAVEVLETYYSHAEDKLDTLKKRCLLTVNKKKLEMHDLLRDIGRKVAHNNDPDEPGKHSRLWLPEDIRDVLQNHEGAEAIEGIIPRDSHYQDALEGGSFTTEAFKRMSKLRFLKLKNIDLTGSFKHTFKYLRWLQWHNCPLKCLPAEFYPQKLVILELPYCHMTTMWELNMVSHVYENLKTVNISQSKYLTATPDFTKLPRLETLNFEGCGLEEVHTSIGSLARLQSLNLNSCVKLRSLPDSICNLKALKVLDISHCNSLEALPIQLGNIKSLTKLNAANLTVSKLPDSIGHLTKLVTLNLSNNKKLETLPDTIFDLGSLEFLHISDCNRLEALPIQLGNIVSLTVLSAGGLNVSKLPDSMKFLTKLVKLNICYNKKLETLPVTICNLTSLETLDIHECEKLEILPDQLWKITRLRKLDARNVTLLEKLPDIGSSQTALSLQELNLSESGIITLPSGFSQLSNLDYLDLRDCRRLLSIPELPPNLKQIKASGCESLERIPNLSNVEHLENLLFSSCIGLTEILGLEKLSALRELDLTDCSGLTEIQGLEELTSIAILRLGGSYSHLASKHLTKCLFQIYSQLEHQITIRVFAPDSGDFRRPDWIIKSPYWTSKSSNTQSSGYKSTTVYADLLPNESHNFRGIILCFKPRPNEYSFKFDCSVRNTTSGFIWTDTHDVPYRSELMVIVPKSIFSVRDDHRRIEITAQYCVIIDGIHLLYKTENENIGNDQGNRSG